MRMMKEKGIDLRPFFYPLSLQPAYARLVHAKKSQEKNPITYRISPYGVNLPCGMNIDEEKVRYVCESLKMILIGNKNDI